MEIRWIEIVLNKLNYSNIYIGHCFKFICINGSDSYLICLGGCLMGENKCLNYYSIVLKLIKIIKQLPKLSNILIKHHIFFVIKYLNENL